MSFNSENGLVKVLSDDCSEIEGIELEIIIDRIGTLKTNIKKLEKAITEQSEKLRCFEN